jgi:hypothetical protein
MIKIKVQSEYPFMYRGRVITRGESLNTAPNGTAADRGDRRLRLSPRRPPLQSSTSSVYAESYMGP